VAKNSTNEKILKKLLQDSNENVIIFAVYNKSTSSIDLLKKYKENPSILIEKALAQRLLPTKFLEEIAKRIISEQRTEDNLELAETLSRNPKITNVKLRLKLYDFI